MPATLVFNFNKNYSIEINSEDVSIIRMNLTSILDSISCVKTSNETVISYITGEKDQIKDENEMMYHDRWALTIYSTNNQRNKFIKQIGESCVHIRAMNNISKDYEDFTMDVSLAVDVMRDLIEFLR
jgi:hypothetical protein